MNDSYHYDTKYIQKGLVLKHFVVALSDAFWASFCAYETTEEEKASQAWMKNESDFAKL